MREISPKRMRELVDYDQSTGFFTSRVTYGRWRAGRRVGTDNGDGYRRLFLDGNLYLEHRAAVAWMTGRWPKKEVDHKNGVRSDNRRENLRLASRTENARNRRRDHDNPWGLKGVTPYKYGAGGWMAQIIYNRKHYHLGIFPTAKAAHKVYCSAAGRLHREFASSGEQ